jgi:hypothetical protein
MIPATSPIDYCRPSSSCGAVDSLAGVIAGGGTPLRPRAFAAARPSRVPLADEVGEELVIGGDHVEQQPTGPGRGVDALLQNDQVDSELAQLRGDAGEVVHRPAHPRQPCDDQLVALAQLLETAVPVGGGSLSGLSFADCLLITLTFWMFVRDAVLK